MPASKSTIAPTLNYIRIHTLVDAYKISCQYDPEWRIWIASQTAPDAAGVTQIISHQSTHSSVDATIGLLCELGHEKELFYI